MILNIHVRVMVLSSCIYAFSFEWHRIRISCFFIAKNIIHFKLIESTFHSIFHIMFFFNFLFFIGFAVFGAIYINNYRGGERFFLNFWREIRSGWVWNSFGIFLMKSFDEALLAERSRLERLILFEWRFSSETVQMHPKRV